MHPRQPPADSPERLRPFIEAARAQAIEPSRVSADAVLAGLEQQRRRTHARRIVLLSAGVAVAASLFAVALVRPLLSDGADSTGPVAVIDPEPERASGPKLASDVRLRSTDAIEIRGPWAIALHDGTHEVAVAPGEHRLAIALPEHELELELVEGRLTVELERESGLVAVRLHTGVAAWIDAQGERTQISVERVELGGEPPAPELDAIDSASEEPRPTPTAAALAREAETLLAAGKRDEAVTVYRQLIRKHPRASQTRAAVVDLARLLRADNQKDRARCAYRLYLERWPDSAIRAEVESQLARLGDGPRCRGLEPIDG